MINVKGAVKFKGRTTIKILLGWEGLTIAWTEADTPWENWF